MPRRRHRLQPLPRCRDDPRRRPEGIRDKLDPGQPHRENMYHYSEREVAQMGIETLPRTLSEAIDAFEADPLSRRVRRCHVPCLCRVQARRMECLPHPCFRLGNPALSEVLLNREYRHARHHDAALRRGHCPRRLAPLAQAEEKRPSTRPTIYVGWMPWKYADESGIMKKWADKYGIEVNISQINDYVESINQYSAGQFDGVVATSMDALSIPAAGGVDTTALIVGSYSNGNDGPVMKGTSDLKQIKGQQVHLVELSVSHYIRPRRWTA